MEMKMEGGYIFSVVLTGLTVVFIGLILLILFVWLMGKVFAVIKEKKAEAEKAAAPAPAKTETPAAPVPSPEVEDGISDEIVAVIAAAVAAMSGSYAVKSVRRASAKTSRRTVWGAQGVSESTRTF